MKTSCAVRSNAFEDLGVTDFNAAIMDTEDGAYAEP